MTSKRTFVVSERLLSACLVYLNNTRIILANRSRDLARADLCEDESSFNWPSITREWMDDLDDESVPACLFANTRTILVRWFLDSTLHSKTMIFDNSLDKLQSSSRASNQLDRLISIRFAFPLSFSLRK